MILSVQIATLLFGLAIGWLNKWPVFLIRKFIPKEDKKPMRQLHLANGFVKAAWCGSSASRYSSDWLHFFLLAGLLWLIIWLVFDPVVNKSTGKAFFYLGEEAHTDKIVKNGLVKSIIVSIAIIILNIIIL